ncbi:hypothetical protein [Pontiella desulfatans]|uniref:hypothetical protein n=1 Tax=Pontiella desulfatans TaxID=2750659 RepID=UPI00109CC473|nr:hypothetical protein [Pontiella desulfatans]
MKSWTLESTTVDRPETRLVESGNWDGKTMTVKAKSWTDRYETGKPLIARYALWPLLASGKLKKAPLEFDLLEDCALRRGWHGFAGQLCPYRLGQCSHPLPSSTKPAA